MNKFDKLLEHSLWDTNTEKIEFLKKKIKLNNSFWITFLGTCALRKNYKDNKKVKNYFTTISNFKLAKIDENDNDLIYSIKTMVETGQIADTTATVLLKIISKLATGVDLDEGVLFESIKKVMSGKIVGKILPSKIVVELIRDFKKNKATLNDMIVPYYNFAKAKKIADDFVKLAKPIINKVVVDAIKDVEGGVDANSKTLKNMAKTSDDNDQAKDLKKQAKPLNFFELDVELGNTMLKNSTITGIPALAMIIDINKTNDWISWDKSKLNSIISACSGISTTNVFDYLIKLSKIADFKNMFDDSVDSFLYKLAVEIPDELKNIFDAIIKCINIKENTPQRINYKILNILIPKMQMNPDRYINFIEKHLDTMFFTEVKYDTEFGDLIVRDIDVKNFLFNLLIKDTKYIVKANARDLKDELYSKFFKSYLSIFRLTDIQIELFTMLNLYKPIASITTKVLNSLFDAYLLKKKTFVPELNKIKILLKNDALTIDDMINTHVDEFIKYLSNDSDKINKYIDTLSFATNTQCIKILNIINFTNIELTLTNQIKIYIRFIDHYNHDTKINKHIIKIAYDIVINGSVSLINIMPIVKVYQKINSKDEKKLIKDLLIKIYTNEEFFEYNTLLSVINMQKCDIDTSIIKKFINKYGVKSDIGEIYKKSIDLTEENFLALVNTYKRFEISFKRTPQFIFDVFDILTTITDLYVKPKKYVYDSIETFLGLDDMLKLILPDMKNSTINMKIQNNIDIVYGLYKAKKLIGPNSKKIYDYANDILNDTSVNELKRLKNVNEKLLSGYTECNVILNDASYINLFKYKQNIDTEKYLNKNNFSKAITSTPQIRKAFEYLDTEKSIEDAIKILNAKFAVNEDSLVKRDIKYVLSRNENFVNILKDKIGYKKVFELFDIPKTQKHIYDLIVNDMNNKKIVNILKDEKSNNGIIPNIKNITAEETVKLFKFNKFNLQIESEQKTDNNTYLELINAHGALADKYIKELPNVKVQKVERTKEELTDKTVNFYKKHSNGKHGDFAMKILEEFNVELPDDEWQKFRKIMFAGGVKGAINPAFHATGSIAASMILRFGFTVTSTKKAKSSGVSTAGRMLGDGIYFTDTLDKAAGYLGDKGWQRKYGTVGYLFEMDATLGNPNVHYRDSGVSDDDVISPEWCAYYHEKQLKVLKVYKTELVSTSAIKKMRESQKTRIMDSSFNKIFGNILIEAKDIKMKDMISWVFYDGDCIIPSKKGGEVKFVDDIKILNKNVFIEPHQKGCMISLRNTVGINNIIHVPNPYEFMGKDPEGLFSQFKALMSRKIK